MGEVHGEKEDSIAEGAEAQLPREGYTEVVEDAQRVLAIVDALSRYGSPGRIEAGVGATPCAAKLVACDPNLKWELAGDGQGLQVATGDLISFELDALNTNFRFETKVISVNDTTLVAAWPQRITRIRRRWHRRTSTSAPLVIKTARRRSATGRMRDISYNGVSFELDGTPEEEAKLAAELGPGASVELFPEGDGSKVATMVRIHQRRTDTDGRSIFSGEVQSTENKEWQQLVTKTLNPHTQLGSGWADAQWALYERAGYFSLSDKKPEHFAALKQSFKNVCEQLDDIRQLACSVVWPASNANDVIATATMFRVYANTWMGFQLAKITGSFDGKTGREILRRTLLHCYEHMQRYDSGVRWVAMLVQAKRTWSAYFMYELPLRYVEQGLAAIVRFRALEIDVAADLGPISPELPTGRLASTAEAKAVGQEIERIRPALYCSALDLTPARIGFQEVASAWQQAKLARTRAVYVVEVGGVCVAGAVFEMGEDGVHLFGLLDLVRAYPLAEGGERYIPKLVQAAQEWFRNQGKQRFVLMLENDAWFGDEYRAEIVDMGESDAVILSVDRLPEFLEHLYEITAPRTSGESTFHG